MAEKKKYNSILISGRKDETLTYSKYVKDEESGESVKESLDKKVNITDELTTQQIKDGAITNEKMAADSVNTELNLPMILYLQRRLKMVLSLIVRCRKTL